MLPKTRIRCLSYWVSSQKLEKYPDWRWEVSFDFDHKTKYRKCWRLKTYVVESRISDKSSLSIHKLYYTFLLVIWSYWELELLVVTHIYSESVTFQTAILSFYFSKSYVRDSRRVTKNITVGINLLTSRCGLLYECGKVAYIFWASITSWR